MWSQDQSHLYISQVVRHFHETEVEIWAGVSEIKLRYATCEGSYVFMDKTYKKLTIFTL